jgi:hypothetical protein
MNALRRGSSGILVVRWQSFLLGRGFKPGPIDGNFGKGTDTATKEFQKANSLFVDGVAGNETLAKAASLGFPLVADPEDNSKNGPNWPPPPNFSVMGLKARQTAFKEFQYKPAPRHDEARAIKITDDWPAKNIVTVDLPELAGIKGVATGKVEFHKAGAAQLKRLVTAWSSKGLISRILRWNGAWVPRFTTGFKDITPKYLSNHAWGIAFDINADQNGFGAVPAFVGQPGSVRELVQIANANGFFWGGHFEDKKRLDGMHFEIAQLL